MADEYNNIEIWCALAGVPAQQIKTRRASVIPYSKNSVGLMSIPVNISGVFNEFLFDTGAELCVLSYSMAQELHLDILNTTVTVAGTTGVNNASSLAVADSLLIGENWVYNVVFLVLPDEKLTFPQINLKINGIIGFPVISQLKELHFSKTGLLSIPLNTTSSELNNLALMGSKSLLQLGSDSDTLNFLFDTGANTSELFSNYFEKHRSTIEKYAESDSLLYGSIGETKVKQVYRLKNFPIIIGGKKVLLPEMSLYKDAVRPDHRMFDGCIGQDLVSLFKEMVISYEYMYVDFK